MLSITKKIALYYGLWSFLWVCVAGYGAVFTQHGEFAMSAHLLLTLTGFPLSLLSWFIIANGSVLGVVVAGILGVVQWCLYAEVNDRTWTVRGRKK